MQKTIQNSLCKKIRYLRQQRNWSQEELARRIGISAPSVSKIEAGVTDITVSGIKQIAVAYELSIAELLSMPEDSVKNTVTPSPLDECKAKLAMRDTEVLVLRRRIIELYEELKCNRVPA
ncbi:MAG TPA: helix-turn-helix transcriptional regulator [Mucilaginibacter sp.]